VRLLLDRHIVLRWRQDSRRLGREARATIVTHDDNIAAYEVETLIV
jgi:PIN domain nuclease of toxin-antitoxin system